MKFWLSVVAGLGFALVATVTLAARPTLTLVIENHRFQPTELRIPAATKVLLLIENRDATPEEFESTDFNREKIVMPKSTIKVFVGPLDKGRYRFFGEFHQDTAQGVLIVE